MTKLNRIQSEIKQLEGGRFQKICDIYLYRKLSWENIHSLGSMDGTDKTTKGIPDTYYFDENINQYILVMYGTREDTTKKLINDIEDAIQKSKLDKKDISKIICCHTSSNIPVDQDKELKQMAKPIELALFGIDTIAQDLLQSRYQDLTLDYLGISKSTDQVWTLDQFIDIHDRSKTNASLGNKYIDNSEMVSKCIDSMSRTQVLLLVGKSGTGKTRLAVEVCKQLPKDANVICVKSNSQSAYQDIKDAIDENRVNYLLLDDSNNITNLNAIVALLILPNLRTNLKIIMTVRDYAFQHVKETLKAIDSLKIEVEKTKDDDIKELLTDIVGKLPLFIENKIIKLSHGNPRIAVLAATLIKEGGHNALRDGNSVLESYYENILDENYLSEKELKALFILSFILKVKLEDNGLLADIISFVNITYDEFVDSIYRLHDKELCDIFNDRVVKVSDQSLKDFIIYKYIVRDKNVDLECLFSKLYPKYSKNIILSLNSINVINSTKEWYEFIEIEMKKIWKTTIKQQDKEEFLKQFAALLPFETLDYVFDSIEEVEKIDSVEITQNEIEKMKNNQEITDATISLLCSLSKTEKFNEAAQLIVRYLEKRPDKIMQVYFAIINYFGVEIESADYYVKMRSIVNALKSVKVENLAIDLIDVNIGQEFLKLRNSKVNPNGKQLTITNYTLVDGVELRELRKSILNLLASVYFHSRDDVKNVIEKILLNFPVYEIKNEFSGMIQADLEIIESCFFDLENITPRQENVISKLRVEAENLGSAYVPFMDFELSPRQELYDVLMSRNLNNKLKEGYKKYEKERRRVILAYFERYDEVDLNSIFDNIAFFKRDEFLKDHKIDDAIYILFNEAISERQAIYLKCLLNSDFEQLVVRPSNFYGKLSIGEVNSILLKIEEKKIISEDWRFSNLLRSENITSFQADQIVSIIQSSDNEVINRHKILDFEKYVKHDIKVLECLLSRYQLKQIDPKFFIPDYILEDDARAILKLIKLPFAKKIYLENIEHNIDHTGQLFWEIVAKEDDEFVFEFLKRLSDNRLNIGMSEYSRHLQSLIELPCGESVIIKYLNYLIDEHKVFYVGLDPVLKIILKSDLSKSKLLLMSEIQKSDNATRVQNIVNVANMIFDTDTRLEFFTILKDKKLTLDVLKEIHILPLESSWSGSRVPLLDKDIDFLDNLLEIFTELEYIKYAKYLLELKDEVRGVKEKELIDDYMEEE